MGTWGVGIFQNDIGDDIRSGYVDKLKMGRSNTEALEDILAENGEFLDDAEDACDLWLALASVMYDYGRLTDDVKEKALSLIGCEEDMSRWTGSDIGKRKKELDKLRDKLDSEPKPEKKVTVVKRFVSSWKRWDIYCAKISDICKCDREGWLVFLVSDVIEYDARIKGLGDMLPVTYLKYSESEPKSIEDVQALPFVYNYSFGDDTGYRFLWYCDGFARAKSKFVFLGNNEFESPDNFREMSFNDKLRAALHLSNIPDLWYWDNISEK